MSHRMIGSIVLTDCVSLRKAVTKDPRLEWVEGATTFKYYYADDSQPCVHKIKVVGQPDYEIGVVPEPDGTGYRLMWESDSGFSRIIGSKGEEINTAYAKEVSRDWAAKNGFTVSETTDEEGLIVLTMEN